MVFVDKDEKVLFGIYKNGNIYAPGLKITSYDNVITELQNDIAEIKDVINLNGDGNNDTIEVAIGNKKSYGTYISELKASPFVDNQEDYYTGYTVIKKSKVDKPISKNIVIFNHDDGQLSDSICARKIYNKYGFHGSFCYVFRTFSSIDVAKQSISATKKLINEGHDVGLHAIINCSYWRMNKMWDVKPDGTSNLAPSLSEIRGNNPDGTGENAFGKSVSSNTNVDFMYLPSSFPGDGHNFSNKKVLELTEDELNYINSQFVFYTDSYL